MWSRDPYALWLQTEGHSQLTRPLHARVPGPYVGLKGSDGGANPSHVCSLSCLFFHRQVCLTPPPTSPFHFGGSRVYTAQLVTQGDLLLLP